GGPAWQWQNENIMSRKAVKASPKKSPYFTPPATPSKAKNRHKKSRSEPDSKPKKRRHAQDDSIPQADANATTVKHAEKKPKKRSPKKPKSPSCIPFAPTDAPCFGLIQEKLAHDPFRLLVATIFLNRTRGKVAIPVLYKLFELYPTPADLASANVSDVAELMQCLGLQNSRAKKCVELARMWLTTPPIKGVRYRRLHYPQKKDGSDIKPREVIDDKDTRVAWEAAHLPGVGPYALDSWRIFCRDVLRGLSKDWQWSGTATHGNASDVSETSEGIVPEWQTVLPKDKELRAYLAWMWLKQGFEWNCLTGERRVVRKKIRRAIAKGRALYLNRKGKLKVIKSDQ
ncbi:hypothetical protein KEM55_008283, partial [Ascosphaera atra]